MAETVPEMVARLIRSPQSAEFSWYDAPAAYKTAEHKSFEVLYWRQREIGQVEEFDGGFYPWAFDERGGRMRSREVARLWAQERTIAIMTIRGCEALEKRRLTRETVKDLPRRARRFLDRIRFWRT